MRKFKKKTRFNNSNNIFSDCTSTSLVDNNINVYLDLCEPLNYNNNIRTLINSTSVRGISNIDDLN